VPLKVLGPVEMATQAPGQFFMPPKGRTSHFESYHASNRRLKLVRIKEQPISPSH
jgi:hypothetical protein